MGWGVVMNDSLIGGRWLFFEVENYINCFEFLVVFFVLKCFQSLFLGKYVKIMIDNIIVVFVINNMGICYSDKCNLIFSLNLGILYVI